MKKLLIKAISSVLLLTFSANIACCDSDFYHPNQNNLAPYSIFKKASPAESSPEFKDSTISNIKALAVFFTIFQSAVVENTEKRLLPKVLRHELQGKDFNDIIDRIDFEKIEADKLHGVIFIPFDRNKEVRVFNSDVPKETLVARRGEKVIEEGESAKYIIQVVDKGPEKKIAPQPALASIPGNKGSDIKQARDSKTILKGVSDLMVSIHNEICAKFPRYKFTIRDLKKWVVFVKRYTNDFGLAQAIVRGCLYVYSDRLLTAKDKKELFDTLSVDMTDIISFSASPVDIDSIAMVSGPSEENAALLKGDILSVLFADPPQLIAETISILLRMLRSDSKAANIAAMTLLKDLPPEIKIIFVDVIIKHLKDNNSHYDIRRSAAKALGALGIKEKQVIDALLESLKDSDGDACLRGYSAQSLGSLGVKERRVIDTLLESLREDGGDFVRMSAAKALGNLGVKERQVIDALLKSLRNKNNDWPIRAYAAHSLGILSGKDKQVVNALRRTLNDDDQDIRMVAAHALGILGDKERQVVDALLESLADNLITSRLKIEALVSMCVKDQFAKDALLKYFKDSYLYICGSSTQALDVKNTYIIDILLKSLSEGGDEFTRSYAAEVLGILGLKDKYIIDALIKSLSEDVFSVRRFAAHALGILGVKEKQVIDALRKSLKSVELGTRISAAEALVTLGVRDKGIVDLLFEHLKDNNSDDLCMSATQVLVQLLQPQVDSKIGLIADLVANNLSRAETSLTEVKQSGSASSYVKLNPNANTVLIGDLSIPISQSNQPDDPDIPPLDKVDLVLTKTTVENLQRIAYAVDLNDPLLLVGPTATGKSSPIKYLASLTHNKHIAISMNKDISGYELIGGFKPKTGQDKDSANLEYKEGTLVKAMKEGYWFTLEELNLAPTEVLELLNFYLVHGYLIVNIQGKEEKVMPHKDFRLFATMNPESYAARTRLSDALMGRFRVKYFGSLPDAELAEIVEVKYAIPTEIGIRLVQAHNTIEALAKSRTIGKKEKEPYEFNLRNLLRLTYRIRQDLKDKDISKMSYEELLPLIAHHINEIYLDVIRDDNDRKTLFTSIDTILAFTVNHITYDSLRTKVKDIKDVDLPTIKGDAKDEDVPDESAE